MDTNNSTIDDLFPSKWLRAADLGNTPKTVTITAVDFELIGQDNEKKAVISFAGATKRLILNKTNALTITGLYGKQISSWLGKKITLYSIPVLFRGEQVPAVRVKAEIPGQPPAQTTFVKPEPVTVMEEPTADDYIPPF
jgi:hypothetical protein